MRHYLISFGVLLVVHIGTISAENTLEGIKSIRTEVNALKTKQKRLNNDILLLTRKNRKAEGQIAKLQSLNKGLTSKVDSLQAEQDKLAGNQKADKKNLYTA